MSLSATLAHMTESVGSRALQQHASEVVRRAAAGETLIITHRGRPVARLVLLGRNPRERLVAEGLARPARRRARDLPPPLPASGPPVSELLADARRDER